MNLLQNALDALEGASAGGSARVDVELIRDGEELRLRIRDNGPGISEDVLDRIFDPFFTTRVQGTGLGLAVVAMTVSNHGGEISVQNRAEGGAEFLINLPIQNQDAGPPAPGLKTNSETRNFQ